MSRAPATSSLLVDIAWVLGVVSLALSGCAPVRSGTFDSMGFRHLNLEYRVVPDATGALAGDWTIDNYRPGFQELKSGDDNVRALLRDVDGDGDLDDLGAYPVDDLRFRSVRTAGVMWVRSIPLPTSLGGTELRVLARLFVDSITGVGLQVVELRPGAVRGVARRYATRDVQTHAGALDGREAFQVRFEVASVDQAQAGGDARWERAHLVFIRANLVARFGYQLLPVLIVAGYSNLPDDFDREAHAFHSLLSRIQLETATTRALRDPVLACAPGVDVVPFTVGPTGLVTLPPGLVGVSGCVQQAVWSVDLGRIDGWRSFAIHRTPLASP